MSIFGSILGAIFGHAQQQSTSQTPAGAKPGTPSPASAGGQNKGAPTGQQPQSGQSKQGTTGQPPAPAQPVDVAAVLDKLKADKHANLDWQHSIVDLMKLLDLESSLSARQELAKELHYTGNAQDSATMNIWLHKQVMTKLAENGGKVPDSLRH